MAIAYMWERMIITSRFTHQLAMWWISGDTYTTEGGLNHIGVVVDDLDAVAAKVTALGYALHSFGAYEPGRRFYFDDADNIEVEVVSYR